MKPNGIRVAAAARGRAVQRGFTLIELVVTLAIVAILAVLAVPSFTEIALSSKLNSISSGFVASAQLARSEAIKRNAQVTLSAPSGAWKDGWVVFHDDNKDGTAQANEVVSRQAAMPNGYLMSDQLGGATTVTFQPTGVGATQVEMVVCRATPTVGDQKRTITISATGRPDAKKGSATSCS